MIHLVRHGETEFNIGGRFQGALDSPLTARGVAQARDYAKVLRDLVPADCRIVSSPQGRAKATATILAEAGGFTRPVATDARLREISLGAWDGRLRTEVAAEHPCLWSDGRLAGMIYEDLAEAVGGESYDAFAARLAEWLAEAAQWEHPVIVVSHGVASRFLRGLYSGLTREQFLQLDVPQDAVFRFVDGIVQRFDCEPAPVDETSPLR
jgi:probable phosphoglycerate mutase